VSALRWIAVVLALVAVADPRIPLPRRERPGVRVDAAAMTAPLAERLRAAAFPIVSSGEAATIVAPGVDPPSPQRPVYLLSPGGGVTIVGISASATRAAGQSVTVSAMLRARGRAGQSTTIQLEDTGLPVASSLHTWKGEDETWTATFDYLPATSGASVLRVRVLSSPGSSDDPVTADVLASPIRDPIPTLVYESDVTWPAVFVRRALEQQPGFRVASVQHATKAAATLAGAPPAALRAEALAPYDLVVCGSLEGLSPAEFEAVRWFVETRGGILVFVPDRLPGARAAQLVPGLTFEAKQLETAVPLRAGGEGLSASEFAMPRLAGGASTPLALDGAARPVVMAIRRGAGAIVVSGALDAWRYRDRGDGAFSRFWAATLLAQAATVPRRLEVAARPSVVRPGDAVRVRVRLADRELTAGERVGLGPARAHAADATIGGDTAVRLWPSGEPGLYEGDWRPARGGRYVVSASVGDARGETLVYSDPAAAGPPSNAASLRIAAQASGGGVFTDDRALVGAMAERLPLMTVTRSVPATRSPWWAAAFAICLTAEWAIRRRRGLR
jgi:hypothetical protein